MLDRFYARIVPVTGIPSEQVHAEARAASVRASLTYTEAKARQGKVDALVAKLRLHAEANHLGEMISESMGLDKR